MYVTSSIFLNYMKKKCAMEMKRNVKLSKKKIVKYEKKMHNGNKKTCKITEKTL